MATINRGYPELPANVNPDVPHYVNLALRRIDTDVELLEMRTAAEALNLRQVFNQLEGPALAAALAKASKDAGAAAASAKDADASAKTALGLLVDAQAPTDAFVAAVLNEISGPSATGEAARALAARPALQREQLDRQGQAALSMYQGRARVATESNAEVIEDWANLDGVNANGVTVDGNRLVHYPVAAPNAAKKPWNVPAAGGVAHAVIDYQGPGVYMFGVAGSAAAPLQSTTDGFLIGFRAAEPKVGVLVGTGIGGTGQLNLDTAEAVPGKYLATVLVDRETVTLSLKHIATEAEWHKSLPRSVFDAVGGIKHVVAYAARAGNSSEPSYIEPIVAISGATAPRTKALAGKKILGSVPVVSYLQKDADNWRIQLPANYDPRVPTPLVMWLHNNSGTALNGFTDVRMRPLMDALSAAGYIVASADADGSAWGNDASRAKYVALYEYVRSRYAVSCVALVGVSMGGQVALNLLPRAEIPNIVAYLGIGAVASVEDLWAGYAPTIKAAFSVDALAKVPPAHRPELRAGHEFRGVPVMLVHSAGDMTCHLDYSKDLLARLAPYTPEARLYESTGVHIAAQQFKDAVTYGIPFLRKYAPAS